MRIVDMQADAIMIEEVKTYKVSESLARTEDAQK